MISFFVNRGIHFRQILKGFGLQNASEESQTPEVLCLKLINGRTPTGRLYVSPATGEQHKPIQPEGSVRFHLAPPINEGSRHHHCTDLFFSDFYGAIGHWSRCIGSSNDTGIASCELANLILAEEINSPPQTYPGWPGINDGR